MNSMLTLIKQAAVEVWESLQPTVFFNGQVMALEPLTVKVDNRFELSGEALVVPLELRSGAYQTHTHTIDPHDHTVQPHTHTVPNHQTSAGGDPTHAHGVPPVETEEKPLISDPTGLITNATTETYHGLQVGDKVVLLRNQGGQRFLILGRLP